MNKDDADGFDLETVEDVYAVQVDEYATEKQAARVYHRNHDLADNVAF